MEEGEDMAREKQEISTTKTLSPVSQLFVTPSFYSVIVFTLGFKTRCNSSAIADGINNTWLKLPRFCSKVVMNGKKNGEVVWVPVNVRLEDHLIVSDLDDSNIENPDEFIEHYTSNLANSLMNMSIPLWEFHILNIKTTNAESFLIGKFHHSLGDGMSLMSLLLAYSRKTSDLNALPTMPIARKQVNSSAKVWWFVARIWFMIRVLFTTSIELLKTLLTLCFMRDSETPLMRKSGDVTLSRKVISRVINFDDIKLVKNTMNMKVNDVLLGMTQAGFSKYLSRKYGNGDKAAEKSKILKQIRLRGTVIVNLRPSIKIEDLDNMMVKGSKCRWGNFVGIVIFPLWIKSEENPLEYVRRARATMDTKKNSMESLFCYGFIKLTMKLLGEKVAGTIVRRIFGQTTLTFSSVMGPNEEMSLFGHPISYIAASALLGPQALILHYVSYANKITINLAVDTRVIPDPHQLCDDVVESLNTIKLAVMQKGLHKVEV